MGDSTVSQLFLSLALQLGGSEAEAFGPRAQAPPVRPAAKTTRPEVTVLIDTKASACDDTVRINFVRNDLLALSNSGHEYNLVRGQRAA